MKMGQLRDVSASGTDSSAEGATCDSHAWAPALIRHADLDLREIAEESLRIAASIDIYTNDQLTIEEI